MEKKSSETGIRENNAWSPNTFNTSKEKNLKNNNESHQVRI